MHTDHSLGQGVPWVEGSISARDSAESHPHMGKGMPKSKKHGLGPHPLMTKLR